MSDFLQEIAHEVNVDKAKAFYKKYKKPIISAVLMLVVVAIFLMWYGQYRVNKINSDGGQYLMALAKIRSGSLDEAMEKFSEVGESDTGYGAISNMNLASYEYFKGNFEKSFEIYTDIANHSSYPLYISELAGIMAFSINEEKLSKSNDDILSRVDNFVNGIKIYRATAMEIALVTLLEAKQHDEAMKYLNKLQTMSDVNDSAARRIANYSSLINN